MLPCYLANMIEYMGSRMALLMTLGEDCSLEVKHLMLLHQSPLIGFSQTDMTVSNQEHYYTHQINFSCPSGGSHWRWYQRLHSRRVKSTACRSFTVHMISSKSLVVLFQHCGVAGMPIGRALEVHEMLYGHSSASLPHAQPT